MNYSVLTSEILPSDKKQRVLVVGGGPAGMVGAETAEWLAERKIIPEIFEMKK